MKAKIVFLCFTLLLFLTGKGEPAVFIDDFARATIERAGKQIEVERPQEVLPGDTLFVFGNFSLLKLPKDQFVYVMPGEKAEVGESQLKVSTGQLKPLTQTNISPYRAKAEKGNVKVLQVIKDSPLSESEKQSLSRAVKSYEPTPAVIKNGEYLVCMSDASGAHCTGYQWQMADDNGIAGWTAGECQALVKKSCGNVYIKCKNPRIYTWAEPTPPPPPTKQEEPPVEKEVPPVKQEVPPVKQNVPPKDDLTPTPIYQDEDLVAMKERLDVLAGGGLYRSTDVDSGGDYEWVKARFFLPWFDVDLENGDTLLFGPFVFGAVGKGNDLRWDYNWWKFAFGPAMKYLGESQDANIDVGVGMLNNSGGASIMEKNGWTRIKSDQTDIILYTSFHLNNYLRRDRDEKWRPKWELNFEGNFVLSSSGDTWVNGQRVKSDYYNNSSLSLSFTQWILDINLDEEHEFRLTPGFTGEIGYEFGPENIFLRVGPELVLSALDEDIIRVGLGYKFNSNLSNQFLPFFGHGDLGGFTRWLKKRNIRRATSEEISRIYDGTWQKTTKTPKK